MQLRTVLLVLLLALLCSPAYQDDPEADRSSTDAVSVSYQVLRLHVVVNVIVSC